MFNATKIITSKSSFVFAIYIGRRFYFPKLQNLGNFSSVQYAADIIPLLQTGKLKHTLEAANIYFKQLTFISSSRLCDAPPWILLFDATLCVMCKCRKAFMKFCQPNNCSRRGPENFKFPLENENSAFRIRRANLAEYV